MAVILVIDDVPEIAETVKACMPDFEIMSALDAVTGMDMLADHQDKIVLVLLDIGMPRLDGKAALLLMRNRFPNIPIRIFSALDNVKLLAKELTGKEAILKPVPLDVLRHEIIQSIGQVTSTGYTQPALMSYAHSLAAELEQRARSEPPPVRILVCGSSRIIRDGLKNFLSSANEQLVFLGSDVRNIGHFSQDQGPVIAVVTQGDFSVAITSETPVMCICTDFVEAFRVMDQIETISGLNHQKKIGVLVEDVKIDILSRHIQLAIQRLRSGQSYIPPQLVHPFVSSDSERPLSNDESMVMKYELLNKDTKFTAAKIGHTSDSVRQIRHRLVKKINKIPEEWIYWAKIWWEGHYP